MTYSLTKIAAVAALSLAAATSVALAEGVAPNGNIGGTSVSIEPLGPQPDVLYQAVSEAAANASARVRIAELGTEPRMPFAQQYAATGSANAGGVYTGSLSLNPLNAH